MTTRSVPARQFVIGVPDHRRLATGHELERARHVALAIDSGKDEDGGFHAIPTDRIIRVTSTR